MKRERKERVLTERQIVNVDTGEVSRRCEDKVSDDRKGDGRGGGGGGGCIARRLDMLISATFDSE